MFEKYTKESDVEILEEMKSSISSDVDKSEGSFINDVLSPTSQKIFQNRMILDDILNKVFVQTSYDEWLELLGESRGVFKNKGNKASGNCKFIGKDSTLIRKGTLVQTKEGLQYKTTEDKVISNGSAIVPIIAIDIGTMYNVPANTITEIPITITGITSVINDEPIEGGSNAETNDEYRERILQRVQNPPSSGNKSDYERWAKEVDGVKGAKVIPLWDGPGTVKIIIYGDNGTAVDNKIIQNAKTHIDPTDGKGEGKAPIGATVTIVTVTNKVLNITIIGLETTTLENTKTNIENNIKKYLQGIKPGETVKLKECEAIITKTEGVSDFKGIKLNGKVENVITSDEEKIILGAIDYE